MFGTTFDGIKTALKYGLLWLMTELLKSPRSLWLTVHVELAVSGWTADDQDVALCLHGHQQKMVEHSPNIQLQSSTLLRSSINHVCSFLPLTAPYARTSLSPLDSCLSLNPTLQDVLPANVGGRLVGSPRFLVSSKFNKGHCCWGQVSRSIICQVT